MPFFTVVIPTYNRADLLPRCIDSVLTQSFDDFEIVIVDNYSEDGTKELIEDYQNKDSRIRFIQEHNHGVIAHSRNVGIKEAKGKYIALLDSDDWFVEEKLQNVHYVCVTKKPDLIYSRYKIMSSKGEGKVCGRELTWEDKFYELLIEGDIICNATVVIKKEAVLQVGYLSEEKDLCAVEDMDLWLKFAKKGYSFYFINKCLGYYWVGNNLSYSPKHVQQIENIYNKYIPELEADKKEKCLACRDYTIGRTYHKIGDFDKAIAYYKKALLLQPPLKKIQTLALVIFALFKKKK